MLTTDFDFPLPPELIAQHPAAQRDASKLLILLRKENRIEHRAFTDLPDYVVEGDVLVLNNSKVVPARLRAANAKTGGAFEVFLLEEKALNEWWAMMRPAKRARIAAELALINPHGHPSGITATVLNTNAEGHRLLRFQRAGVSQVNFNIADTLDDLGEVPLPPYIKRVSGESSPEDRDRYQTVYAREKGSAAAPTAGLHFTDELLVRLRKRGVEICHVTLHVGLGTFAPVKTERIEEHRMHYERFHVEDSVARTINEAKQQQRRVIAVGTTSVRVIETLARENAGCIVPGHGRTNIFIYPPYPFRIVDALITNFHLPGSTLLMLVSAFASPGETIGREKILAAYAEAMRERYRFFSYGDAMLITDFNPKCMPVTSRQVT